MDEITVIDFDKILSNITDGLYNHIGSGSGRRVFDLNNGYVVKFARNSKGLAQNKAEYQISLEDKSNLFAKIINISEDSSLLVMEKADQIKRFDEVLHYFNVKNNRELLRLDEINYIFSKYDLLPVDICRSANWGSVNNRIVIIDYGFTRSVKRKYYFPF